MTLGPGATAAVTVDAGMLHSCFVGVISLACDKGAAVALTVDAGLLHGYFAGVISMT